MNHSLRSLLLIAMLALGGLTHTDAFAQQTPPAPPEPPAEPETPNVDIEVERAEEVADHALRAAERAERNAERAREWAEAWFAGTIDDEEAVRRVASGYRNMIEAWRRHRG